MTAVRTLPVSVESMPISSTTFGFRSELARRLARRQLEFLFPAQWSLRYGKWGWGPNAVGATVSFTEYRDTTAEFAAQVILWLPGQPGGFGFRRKEIVSLIDERVVAQLLITFETPWGFEEAVKCDG